MFVVLIYQSYFISLANEYSPSLIVILFFPTLADNGLERLFQRILLVGELTGIKPDEFANTN